MDAGKAEKEPVPATENEILQAGKRAILSALPSGWFVDGFLESASENGHRFDATVGVRFPPSVNRRYRVEIKKSLNRRDLMTMLARPENAVDSDSLIMARHLAAPLRDVLRAREISYADATGNVFLYSTSPMLLVSEQGRETDPWRGPGRPVGTLRGEPASRLVRALVDYAEPYTVPQLSRLANASTGAAYRLVDFLEREAFIERKSRGPVTNVSWRQILERWSQDYSFIDSNTTKSFLEPRGVVELQRNLRQGTQQSYAVTGSLAAQPYAPYAESRLAMIYTDDIEALAKELGLRPGGSGANVILAAPRSPVVFERTILSDDIILVAPSQASADLLTGSGRNPSEGEALLDWMESNTDEWRRQPHS